MRYFKGPTPDNINAAVSIEEIIFGNLFNQRENNQKNKIIVMLPIGDLGTHPSLNAFQELTEAEALEETQKPEWQPEGNPFGLNT